MNAVLKKALRIFLALPAIGFVVTGLLAFASAVQAVRCAVALQTTFGDSASPQPEQALRIRIGLHAGEVIHEDDKFFGKTVIQAFRIADLASANEILISADLRERLGDSGDFAFGTPRSATLRGISGSHELFPVLWEDGAR